MGLSLSAEQKNLLKIFKIEEQYLIPSYQRPYSWEYEQCYQLYNDIVKAYESNEEYFIGNIVIAKNEVNRDDLEIIDGQQRLITLLLMFKTLHILQPNLKILQQILMKEDWEGNINLHRIKSEIFETNDANSLEEVILYTEEEFLYRYKQCTIRSTRINERKAKSRFELNSLYFFMWFKYYKDKNDDLDKLTEYILKRVYLLPIELIGKTREEANNKALTIFETINNRGMNLEDADIFKAKLYQRSKLNNGQDYFISTWSEIKQLCDMLSISIDDLFRYYSHIIRGQEGITTNEINLRDFFINASYSPLEQKKYKDIINDIFYLLRILEFINTNKKIKTSITIWLQLIDLYSNQYPKFALITYFYKNELIINEALETFLESLVRYIYIQGPTTRIKFDIYNIIKQIYSQSNVSISNFHKNIDDSFWEDENRLKWGYCLLSNYLITGETYINYKFHKIISPSNEAYYSLNKSISESFGNIIVTDYSDEKYVPETTETQVNIKERENIIKETLIQFFNKYESNYN